VETLRILRRSTADIGSALACNRAMLLVAISHDAQELPEQILPTVAQGGRYERAKDVVSLIKSAV